MWPAHRSAGGTTPLVVVAENGTGADPLAGAGAGVLDEGEGHSQRVAKVNPTAMKAMPTARFHWPRSFMTGSADRSLEKT